MNAESFPKSGIVFWPVGTGDTTTIVINDELVVQVDIHDMEMANDDDPIVAAVVDRLVEVLPQRDGKPYLAAFILTHADKDHCLGFADLLARVTIGELWATPRLWREYTEEDISLCDDAEAFHEEAHRRVAATLTEISAGRQVASGDRIRVVGMDIDHEKHDYRELPEENLSYPGELVTVIDGIDVSEQFELFIHAPFKDDCAEARNDTSLALQATVKVDGDRQGSALLFGDLAYETIKKIFDFSEHAERTERITWNVLLAPHHCSKKVMYVPEDGTDVLKQDLLDMMEKYSAVPNFVIASSSEFPTENKAGDNPPHVIARSRYEEIAAQFICTGAYPDAAAPEPLVFVVGDNGFEIAEVEATSDESVTKAARSIGAGVLLALGATVVVGGILSKKRLALSGLDRVQRAVVAARGQESAPQRPIGFGNA